MNISNSVDYHRFFLRWTNFFFFPNVEFLCSCDNAPNCFKREKTHWLFSHLSECGGKEVIFAHYSKSQIFVQRFNFDKTIQFSREIKVVNNPPTFSRVFHPKFFLTIFLVKSKLSTAKKSKTAAFSWVFTQTNSKIFLGKSKLNFWTKNEDFEQCAFLELLQTFAVTFLHDERHLAHRVISH